MTKNTLTTKSELLERLKEYNIKGYSVDDEELHPGIYAIGVPIFDHLSKPVAAISAVMPATRVTAAREADIVTEMKRTAQKISKEIKQTLQTSPCINKF
jgi:DNA-binding IclR family transcriptional regulator